MSFTEDAVREWKYIVGAENPGREWLLSNYDTWERNPFYTGKPGPHPEDDFAWGTERSHEIEES